MVIGSNIFVSGTKYISHVYVKCISSTLMPLSEIEFGSMYSNEFSDEMEKEDGGGGHS